MLAHTECGPPYLPIGLSLLLETIPSIRLLQPVKAAQRGPGVAAPKVNIILVLIDLDEEGIKTGHKYRRSIPINDPMESSSTPDKDMKLWYTNLCITTENITSTDMTPAYPFLPCSLRCCIQYILQGTLPIFRAPCPAQEQSRGLFSVLTPPGTSATDCTRRPV